MIIEPVPLPQSTTTFKGRLPKLIESLNKFKYSFLISLISTLPVPLANSPLLVKSLKAIINGP